MLPFHITLAIYASALPYSAISDALSQTYCNLACCNSLCSRSFSSFNLLRSFMLLFKLACSAVHASVSGNWASANKPSSSVLKASYIVSTSTCASASCCRSSSSVCRPATMRPSRSMRLCLAYCLSYIFGGSPALDPRIGHSPARCLHPDRAMQPACNLRIARQRW